MTREVTDVAAATTSSIVLDLVNADNTKRYTTVNNVITTIRVDVALVILQITTGIRSKDVIRNNSIVRAIRLMERPVYKYTFGSAERS